jgi:lipopolysaccharide/colanic/teichoic acid biosynthesis glycosyltransferase
MGNSDAKNSTPREQGAQQEDGRKVLSRFGNVSACQGVALNEETFHAMLTRERRRAERSGKPVVLILLDSHAVPKNGTRAAFLERLTSVVSNATRETDIMGWYEEGLILGVTFTEVNLDVKSPITEVLHSKVMAALRENLEHSLVSKLVVSVHLIPESWDTHGSDRAADIKMVQEHSRKTSKNRLPIIIKRWIDIVGSCLLLLVFSPFLAAIALAIKLGSEGQVIFEQERVGWFGTRFKCLKFRTMYTNNDPKIHRDYVQRLIAGKAAKENESDIEAEPVVYKITSDPRVTPIGKFLRKTSLDEFPQFWNVLRGDMSLVGPRPALPYEFELYDDWHRRRVFEMKPGITGLWQVSGRSSVCFDDMVRLDLRYSQCWSLWLDFKILLATPRAALKGDGAY